MKTRGNIYTMIEDVSRFLLADKKTTPVLKSIRHSVDIAVRKISSDYTALIKNRYSENDVGRNSRNKSEFRRGGVSDILASNFKRVQESFRVLEEAAKLISVPAAATFKELRYKTYELEKELLLKI